MTLTTWAKVVVPELLPTPTAWLGRRPSQAIGDPERWHDPERSNELSDQIAALLPTPTAQAAKHGATPDIHANGFGSNLWDLPHLLPTPLANPSHGHYLNRRLLLTPTGRDHKGRNQRNDETCLPGAILALPSDDGNGSSDDQHPPQPQTEDSDPSSSSG